MMPPSSADGADLAWPAGELDTPASAPDCTAPAVAKPADDVPWLVPFSGGVAYCCTSPCAPAAGTLVVPTPLAALPASAARFADPTEPTIVISGRSIVGDPPDDQVTTGDVCSEPPPPVGPVGPIIISPDGPSFWKPLGSVLLRGLFQAYEYLLWLWRLKGS